MIINANNIENNDNNTGKKFKISGDDVAPGTSWDDALFQLIDTFSLLIEFDKSEEELAKDKEEIRRLKRAYARFGTDGEDFEDLAVELRRLSETTLKRYFDVLDIEEAGADLFSLQGEFDPDVFRAAVEEFIRNAKQPTL